MHAGKSGGDLVDQKREGRRDGGGTRHDHIIMTGLCQAFTDEVGRARLHRAFQPAADTISRHGLADLLGDGKTETRHVFCGRRRFGGLRSTRCGLKGKVRARPAPPCRDMHELGPRLQPWNHRGRPISFNVSKPHPQGLRRRLSREGRKIISGGELRPALGAAVGDHLAAADGRHARAKTVPALADELGGLIGALHDVDAPDRRRPAGVRRAARVFKIQSVPVL